jgi:hypothetical protein
MSLVTVKCGGSPSFRPILAIMGSLSRVFTVAISVTRSRSVNPTFMDAGGRGVLCQIVLP